MRKAVLIALVGATIISAPAGAQDLDWARPKDRELIDGAMRHFASQCGKIGFTQVDALAPAAMQNRLYSRSLLIPKHQAQADLARWAGWISAMTALGDKEKGPMAESADLGGAALAAAVVDPASHDAAKKRFIEVSIAPLRSFKLACDTAAADDFVATHYVAGTGSLLPIEAKFGDVFEQSVSDLKAEETARQK